MDANEINNLADEFNRLQELRASETAGLYNQRDEIQSHIDNINEKYADKIHEIENKLMHMLYLARHNLTEVHIYFMLKEAAEECYAHNGDEKWYSYYKGMKDMASLFISNEKIEEIEYKAQAKYPKLLI